MRLPPRALCALVLGTASFLAAAASPAFAGCHGSACYQQVVTPPVTETVQHEILVAPERHIAHRVPAEYATIEESVTLRGPRQYARHQPAQYSTVAETVLVAPGGRHWQVTQDAYGRTIGCWVDVPPRYATRERTIEVSPATTYYETIPAITGVRQRTVMTRPGGIHVETVPAQYETVSHEVEVAPASVAWQPIGGSPSRHGCGGLLGGFLGACGE